MRPVLRRHEIQAKDLRPNDQIPLSAEVIHVAEVRITRRIDDSSIQITTYSREEGNRLQWRTTHRPTDVVFVNRTEWEI